MKRFFYFLKYIIEDSQSFFIFGVIPLFIISPIIFTGSLNYVDREIISTIKDSGKTYVIYHGSNGLMMKQLDTFHTSKNESTISVWEPSSMSIILGTYFFVDIFVLSLLTLLGAFEFNIKHNWIRSNLYSVKCFEENGLYYYQYKKKLLIKRNKPISKHDIYHIVYNFEENGKELYPDYEGPTKMVRNRKLREILDQ